MAASGIMPRRPRQLSLAHGVPCLVQWLCLTGLVACGALSHLSFVPGVVSWGTQRTAKQVTVRCRRQSPGSPKELSDENPEAEARRLTSRMKNSRSAQELIDVLDDAVDDPIFNHFHATAAYNSLATWKRKRGLQSSDWDGPVIARLHARVQDMVLQDRLDQQASANILWSIAKVADRFSLPTQLLDDLVKSLPAKAQGMIPQALSNCLWAFGQLKEAAPSVLGALPAIVAQIPPVAKRLKSQELSNCLWACAQLKDLAPDVLELVPALAAQIPEKANSMNLQDFCNVLIALLALQDSGLEVVPSLAERAKELTKTAVARINSSIRKLTRTSWILDVSTIVWACARVGVYDSELLASVAQHFPSPKAMSPLRNFGLCALSWSYRKLDTRGDFEDFQKRLAFAIADRGLGEADVEDSELGPLQ